MLEGGEDSEAFARARAARVMLLRSLYEGHAAELMYAPLAGLGVPQIDEGVTGLLLDQQAVRVGAHGVECRRRTASFKHHRLAFSGEGAVAQSTAALDLDVDIAEVGGHGCEDGLQPHRPHSLLAALADGQVAQRGAPLCLYVGVIWEGRHRRDHDLESSFGEELGTILLTLGEDRETGLRNAGSNPSPAQANGHRGGGTEGRRGEWRGWLERRGKYASLRLLLSTSPTSHGFDHMIGCNHSRRAHVLCEVAACDGTHLLARASRRPLFSLVDPDGA